MSVRMGRSSGTAYEHEVVIVERQMERFRALTPPLVGATATMFGTVQERRFHAKFCQCYLLQIGYGYGAGSVDKIRNEKVHEPP